MSFCLTKQQPLRYNRTATTDAALHEPRSSSGPGHRPFKAEITGSNPVRGTFILLNCHAQRSISAPGST